MTLAEKTPTAPVTPKPAADVAPPAPRLFHPNRAADNAKTLPGIAGRLDALEAEVIYLASHLGAIAAHLANGKSAKDVPLEAPKPAEPTEPTPEMGNVAAALAALTLEQKAALRALLGS